MSSAKPPSLSYPEAGYDFCFEAEERSFWFAHRNKVILATVSRFPPPGAILDVGAGNGYVTAALQRAGWEAVAIEPGAAGAEHARARGVEKVICATLDGAGMPPHSAGGVALFDVIEHIENDVAFLRSLPQYLAPGGRVYFTVPAHPALWSSEDVGAGHFRRYTIASLGEACLRAGLAVEFASYFFSLLPLPVYFVRVLPERMGPRRGAAAASIHQHDLGGSALRRFAEKMFAPEARAIARGRRIPFGASCVAVARVAEEGARGC